jgi:hypothetical protein
VPGRAQTLAKKLLDIAGSSMPSAFCISQAILCRSKTALYDLASVPLALANVRTTNTTRKALDEARVLVLVGDEHLTSGLRKPSAAKAADYKTSV